MMNLSAGLFENGFDFIPDVINGDANSDVTGDWINVENCERAYLLLIKPAGTAGDDLSIVINQATTAAGGSSKAVTFYRLWHKVGTMTAVGQWTKVELASGSSDLDLVSVDGTDIASDSSAAVVVVEVIIEQHVDCNGGFKFLQATYEGDDIGNALLINSHWMLQKREGKQVHESALA